MLLLHRYYGNLSTANLPWSASKAGSNNNSISILTEERKPALSVMVSHTLCKHAHTLEHGKEKILSGPERASPPSLSVSVWACWVTRGWNLSELQISTSPLSKSGFVQLFILHGTPISLFSSILRSCAPNNGSVLKHGLMNKHHQWLKVHRQTSNGWLAKMRLSCSVKWNFGNMKFVQWGQLECLKHY